MRASCSAQLVTEPCNRVKRPRNVHSKRHGPVEHLRLLKTGSERLSFVNCRTFGSDDASVQSKLSSYVMQLSRLGVGACGVAETRIPGSGCRNVTKDWQLIYRPEAGSRFRFQGKMCSVPRFQRCQTCQFLVPALGHPLANMSHAGSSKFITKCRVLN